ncbi:MAG: YciI family protein [Terriglobales bacterium]
MGTPTHTVSYAAGPNWIAGQPPEKQDLGEHFAYVERLFKSGMLLANGPTMDDFIGFYVYRTADAQEAASLVANDPAVKKGVLKLVDTATWEIMMDNLDAPVEGRKLYVVNYLPGPNWETGKAFQKQSKFEPTCGYLGAQFEQGQVLAAGPVSDERSRIIIAAADDNAAKDFMSRDPGVAAGQFKVEVKPWQAFNRQPANKSLATAQN